MEQPVSIVFELFLGAMLTRSDYFSYLSESCGAYCAGGMEQGYVDAVVPQSHAARESYL